ncbi:hypothetical protein ABEG63_08075 [Chryseobacterium sp. C39-AII1]|uniref:hypothetical protein n=1 Tax=Chryseobacterium sp. C39-AII1 TaxID=3080332 RepID=UPI003207AD73
MKKIILIAAIGVAGLTSAKETKSLNFEKEKNVSKQTNSEIKSKMNCYSYGIVIGCTNEMISDTACGETYEEARQCMIDNGALMNEYFCN